MKTATDFYNAGYNDVGRNQVVECKDDVHAQWIQHWVMRGAMVREWAAGVKVPGKMVHGFRHYQEAGFASYKDWIQS